MAFSISDFTGPVAPGGDYPFGDIADRSGPVGTRVNRTMMTDMIQFFQKLMDDAGITPNGQPDNASTGYQLLAALDLRYSAFTSTGIAFATIAVPWANFGAPFYNVGYKVDGNEVSLCGVATNSGGIPAATVNLMTLPAAARPASDVKVLAWATITAGTSGLVQLNIAAATGIVSFATGGGTGATVYLDDIRYRKS